MYKIIKDDNAMIGIDLIVALTLIIAIVIMVILIVPNLSHNNISQEDKSDRIMRYMTATRASDSLVQNAGEAGWEAEWKPTPAGNYSNVTDIGLVYVYDDKPMPKVLNLIKVKALMGEGYPDPGTGGLLWWTFPPYSPNSTCNNVSQARSERQNASRALGISGYNLCMRLHPADTKYSDITKYPVPFDFSRLDNYTRNMTDITAASSVDRYVYIINPDKPGEIADKYLMDNDDPRIAVHYRLNVWVW